jgi:hypothetical protein
MIDLMTLDAPIFARLATDSAGAAVRALLPGGGAAVMMVEDMRVEGLKLAALPARPILALRYGPTPLVGRIVNRPLYQWYAYGDPSAGYGPLRALVGPISEAYKPDVTASDAAIGDIEVSAGAQARDDNLKLLVQIITVAVGAV